MTTLHTRQCSGDPKHWGEAETSCWLSIGRVAMFQQHTGWLYLVKYTPFFLNFLNISSPLGGFAFLILPTSHSATKFWCIFTVFFLLSLSPHFHLPPWHFFFLYSRYPWISWMKQTAFCKALFFIFIVAGSWLPWCTQQVKNSPEM